MDEVCHRSVGQWCRDIFLCHLIGIVLFSLLMDIGIGEGGEVWWVHLAEYGELFHSLFALFLCHRGVSKDVGDIILVVAPTVEVANHILILTYLRHEVVNLCPHQVAQSGIAVVKSLQGIRHRIFIAAILVDNIFKLTFAHRLGELDAVDQHGKVATGEHQGIIEVYMMQRRIALLIANSIPLHAIGYRPVVPAIAQFQLCQVGLTIHKVIHYCIGIARLRISLRQLHLHG